MDIKKDANLKEELKTLIWGDCPPDCNHLPLKTNIAEDEVCKDCIADEIMLRVAKQLATVASEIEVGDVVQINEKFGREGWVGAFVQITDIQEWGIIGFVHQIISEKKNGQVPVNLKWEWIEHVGTATLRPAE